MTSAGQHLADRRAEIERLFGEAESWASSDAKLAAHLAAYLSVLITGMIEDCIEKLVIQRAGRPGDIEIENYITKSIADGFRNPDRGKISGTLGQFSIAYQNTFNQKVPPNATSDRALRSILTNKHSLAHEGTYNLKLTIRDVREYYSNIIPILTVLQEILA